MGFGLISGKNLWLQQQVFQQHFFIVVVLGEHNNSCIGTKGSHTGRVVLFVLPVFGQAMHALPPLRPRFTLPPSSFFVGLLLVVALVTVALVMSTATITLWASLMASTMASLMASLMTSLVTTLVTSLFAPLEAPRTSPS